uniref:DH domain-containing protein n=1 Tax=Glossina palpalis gambiensis TaxID=67801 RepID=A0A1B0C389_9MUSC
MPKAFRLLPLATYLLKSVQCLTKYHLLLKDLLRFSDSASCTKELQKSLDGMHFVLKYANHSTHQMGVTGFPTDLVEQGELLLQNSFQVSL